MEISSYAVNSNRLTANFDIAKCFLQRLVLTPLLYLLNLNIFLIIFFTLVALVLDSRMSC